MSIQPTVIAILILFSSFLIPNLSQAASETWTGENLIQKLREGRPGDSVFCKSYLGKFGILLEEKRLVLSGLQYGSLISSDRYIDRAACTIDNHERQVICKIDWLRSVILSLEQVHFEAFHNQVGDLGDRYEFKAVVEAGPGLLSVEREDVGCYLSVQSR